MDSIKKNTVSAKEQIQNNDYVTYDNKDGEGLRVLFVGNSITKHGVKHEIGWYGDWGMAASSVQNDYAHIIMSHVRQEHPDAAFCICQCAEWERQYKKGSSVLDAYVKARNFNADIIIMRIIENCPWSDFEKDIFKQEYDKLVTYLNLSGKAKIIITTGFWYHTGDEVLENYAQEHEYPLVKLGDLGQLDEMKAIGLFEHGGVAVHPGDLGMRTIAKRIISTGEL